jgi:aspartate/methionine/tyrosine aminotransferase
VRAGHIVAKTVAYLRLSDRLPGWRVCWIIGPKDLTSAISQSGSFLDGGASHVMQRAALPLLDYDRVQLEKISLQRAFRIKRDYVLDRLAKMGLEVKVPPKATFYVWLDLKKLEEPINNGLVSDDPLDVVNKTVI